jgi:molecular chaperone DnaK
MIAEAETAKDTDKLKRELADVKGNAEGLIYTTEKSLEEYGHVLSEVDANDIRAYLVELKGQIEGDDVEVIRESIKKLEAASHKMAEAMYAEAAENLGEEA